MTTTNNNSTPQFLTKEYVENILKKYLKDTSLKVLNIEAGPASAKGESYCSIMTRIKVNYKLEREKVVNEINFIVKSTYEDNPYLSGVLKQYDVYNTEMQMYETILPQLEQMLREIGDTDQLCARTIHVDYERDVIIFEDLTVHKFTMANRLEGMDEVHLKLCLNKLAKMHATAAVLNERQSGLLQKYSHGIYNRHVNIYGEFLENVMKASAKFVESCPELGIYYSKKLSQLVPHAVEYATRCYDPSPKHFLTLNHGDMWTNNVMVQYNDEKGKSNVNDILLIDFQYCSWTSPAVDLHYFLNTENTWILSSGVITDFAVSCLLVNFPLLINDKTEDADFETILGSGEKAQRFDKVLYTNKRVQRIVKVMLPKFDQMGLLDVVK
ncbi:uncharacterized protein LOC135963889 [Calliphora vicina]|uniref:uncharacterized protein LOC135963889 n=1 Tax=Calliphora vicina TaxID=7373 RepID=UPI00325B67DB